MLTFKNVYPAAGGQKGETILTSKGFGGGNLAAPYPS